MGVKIESCTHVLHRSDEVSLYPAKENATKYAMTMVETLRLLVGPPIAALADY